MCVCACVFVFGRVGRLSHWRQTKSSEPKANIGFAVLLAFLASPTEAGPAKAPDGTSTRCMLPQRAGAGATVIEIHEGTNVSEAGGARQKEGGCAFSQPRKRGRLLRRSQPKARWPSRSGPAAVEPGPQAATGRTLGCGPAGCGAAAHRSAARAQARAAWPAE